MWVGGERRSREERREGGEVTFGAGRGLGARSLLVVNLRQLVGQFRREH